METTWIEVASDAVKIGLGALIGGAVTVLTLILAHRHEYNKERIRRRQEMLESIATQFEQAHAYFYDLMGSLRVFDHVKKLEVIGTQRDKTEAMLLTMQGLEGKLMLLQLFHAVEWLKRYHLACSDVVTTHGDAVIKAERVGDSEAAQLSKNLTAYRQEFYCAIAQAFASDR